jgi:hypothetical protein
VDAYSNSAGGVLRGIAALKKERTMKYAGLLVMPAGFFLAIAALVLFPASASRAAFVVCGLAVEALGLGVALRGHMEARGESRP